MQSKLHFRMAAPYSGVGEADWQLTFWELRSLLPPLVAAPAALLLCRPAEDGWAAAPLALAAGLS